MQDPAITKLFSLDGKVAIVTGAAGGIGRAIASLFAEAGAMVALADRDETGASTIARQMGTDRVMAVCYDQSDPASIDAMVARVSQEFGELDVIVNCAAAFGFERFDDMTAGTWSRIHSVNLEGVAFCCRAAVRSMLRGGIGGSIINISSIAGSRFVLFDNVAYAASKSGNDGLTRTLARELAEHSIRVNAVIPGAIQNDNIDPAQLSLPLRGPMTQPDFIPLGGFGKPGDIAAACLYLASDASRYVTGQLIAVDGGISIA